MNLRPKNISPFLILFVSFILLGGCSTGRKLVGYLPDLPDLTKISYQKNYSRYEPSHRPTQRYHSDSEVGQGVVRTASSFIGTPYVYGGEDPRGFDCSGLTWYVYKRFGYKLPRTVKGQMESGKWVPKTDLEPGDLVFFKVPGSNDYHVGIYTGRGRFVHSPQSGRSVVIQDLNKKYYQRNYYTARRIAS